MMKCSKQFRLLMCILLTIIPLVGCVEDQAAHTVTLSPQSPLLSTSTPYPTTSSTSPKTPTPSETSIPTDTVIPFTDTPIPLPTQTSVSIKIIRDIPYADGNYAQVLDMYLPEIDSGKIPVIIAIHGSGEMKESLNAFSRYLAEKGFAVLAISRRLGTYPVDEQDTFCAYAWTFTYAEEYNFDPERVIAVGWSRGGYLASLLGTVDEFAFYLEECPHALPEGASLYAVATVAGIFDYRAQAEYYKSNEEVYNNITGYFGSEPRQEPELWANVSSITWIDGSEPPFLLIHGENDTVVPPDQSVNFAAALQESGTSVELSLFPSLSHAIIATSTNVFRTIAEFLINLEKD